MNDSHKSLPAKKKKKKKAKKKKVDDATAIPSASDPLEDEAIKLANALAEIEE